MCRFGALRWYYTFKLDKLLGTSAPKKSTVDSWCTHIRKGDMDYRVNYGGDRSDSRLHHERYENIKASFVSSRTWSIESLTS